ncbi:unnamed protein product [Leptidea sinapis]|uniref:Uncharacterized protein n=1 Tax=Leptidea sinapis TaxID=189913 RepID=A0A5E4PZ17_9NEOP|nr:unnamed protein product [Leptidea sinapis]
MRVLVSISMIESYNSNRFKRAHSDNFNVLLSIYKMNPLKNSDVYKKFSNRVLMSRPDGPKPDLNLNSNESDREKQNDNAKSKDVDELAHDAVNVSLPYAVHHANERFTAGTAAFDSSTKIAINLQTDDNFTKLNQRITRPPYANIIKKDQNEIIPYFDDKDETKMVMKVLNLNKQENEEDRTSDTYLDVWKL